MKTRQRRDESEELWARSVTPRRAAKKAPVTDKAFGCCGSEWARLKDERTGCRARLGAFTKGHKSKAEMG